jgi:pimeloyl-ACP methyl ester carboxylesterase/DNA-binding CsgD family transcriptional regulator
VHEFRQQIRFCSSADRTRIAYALSGTGPALISAANWLTHLEEESKSPVWLHWLTELSRANTLIRYDKRGCGLSQRDAADLSFEACVTDLEAVADATGFDRFALFGECQGGAIAIAYAARHPDRVSHLILYGTFVRGRLKRDPTPEQVAEAELGFKAIEVGWGEDSPAYRQVFATKFMPEGAPEQIRSFCALERAATSPPIAARLIRAFAQVDVREAATKLRCPTVVLHATRDVVVPFEEGRLMAELIPGARLVPLESVNHVLLAHEPAWARFVAEYRAFVPHTLARSTSMGVHGSIDNLTARELEILERMAQGLDNAQIAAHLALSEKTVRNNVTRIFDKLGVENRSQAIVFARDAGFGLGHQPARTD